MSDPRQMIIYLANPYGFSPHMREKLIPDIQSALESCGVEVWEPFQRNSSDGEITPDKAMRIAQTNTNDVKRSDAIFAVLNGEPPDVGVAVELGIAIALGKPTFLFRDDFRVSRDTEVFPLNLMLFGGVLRSNWRQYYYTSVEDITNPKKALRRWTKSQIPLKGESDYGNEYP